MRFFVCDLLGSYVSVANKTASPMARRFALESAGSRAVQQTPRSDPGEVCGRRHDKEGFVSRA